MASIAPDSAKELNDLIGDDSTATFENNPDFIESNPTGNASTENVEVQRDTDDSADSDEEEEEADEEDDLEDDEDDLEDEDEDDELEDEDEDEDLDDEDDDEEEDDAEEVTASPAMRADGLLGYEDEADDVQNKRDREQGDHERAREDTKLDDEEDDDAGDVDPGVTDSQPEDDLDTDRVTAAMPVLPIASYGNSVSV